MRDLLRDWWTAFTSVLLLLTAVAVPVGILLGACFALSTHHTALGVLGLLGFLASMAATIVCLERFL